MGISYLSSRNIGIEGPHDFIYGRTMDFNNLPLGEDLTEDVQTSKQATYDEIVARHTLALSKELSVNGGKLVSKPMAARVAKNPVSQTEYDCRLYALLNIVRNAELAVGKNPLAASWKALYPHIQYNDKATNWAVGKKDRATLIAEMKKQGSYKHIELTRVKHFIARIHTHYLANQVINLTKRVKLLELQQVDNGNIWYQGVEIVKLARTFKVTVGEIPIETRHGTFDKLFEFLGKIDEKLSKGQ